MNKARPVCPKHEERRSCRMFPYDLAQLSFASKSAYRFRTLATNKFIKLRTERFDEADIRGVDITIHVRCKLLESIHQLRSDSQECRQLLFVIH